MQEKDIGIIYLISHSLFFVGIAFIVIGVIHMIIGWGGEVFLINGIVFLGISLLLYYAMYRSSERAKLSKNR